MTQPNAAARILAAECLCFRARRVSRALTRLYDEVLRPLGVQSSQLMLLNAIAMAGDKGAAMKPLADFLVMDRTTLSRNLRPLERAGLVRIARSLEDARARLLRLTPRGRRVVRAALPLWKRAHRQVVGTLGRREALELRRRLDAALTAAGAAPPTPPSLSASSGPDRS